MKTHKICNVLLVTLLSFCMQLGVAFADTLTIAGTGDSQELLRVLAEKFEKEHPQVNVIVPDSVGSSGGTREVLDGKSQLARIARPLTEKEISLDLHEVVFARSPVVFVVHPSVTAVDNLSYTQIIAIYSGEIQNWQQLGGKDKRLYVVSREGGDSSRVVLERHIPGLKAIRSLAGKTFYTTPEAKEALVKYSDTIGYLPSAMLQGTKLRVLSVEHIAPTVDAVASGLYPLSVPLALAWKGTPTDTAKEFVHFLSKAEAKKIINEFAVAVQ